MQQSHEALLLSGGPASGSDNLFEELFFEHYPRLVRTLLRLVGDRGQAEELAADAFCRLHHHGGEHRSEDNPAGGFTERR